MCRVGAGRRRSPCLTTAAQAVDTCLGPGAAAAKRPRTLAVQMSKQRAADSGAAESAGELDKSSAVETAKKWYDSRRCPLSKGEFTMNTPVVGAYRNSGTEWSLLYSIQSKLGHPDTGITYLVRFKFAREGSAWSVASADEENACMHADEEESDIPGLDEMTAVKAAKRWYDKHVYNGLYTMNLPHASAYCNRAHGFPRLWSIGYCATGPGINPEEQHLMRFKYAAKKKGDAWEWRAVSLTDGSTEVDDRAASAPAPAAPDKVAEKSQERERRRKRGKDNEKAVKKPRLTVGSAPKVTDTAETASTQTKRPRLTVGSGSKDTEAGETEAKQTKRPRLTVGSSSDDTSSDKKRPRVALSVASSSSASSAAEEGSDADEGSKTTTTKLVVKKEPKPSNGKRPRVALSVASSSSTSSASEEGSKTTTTKLVVKKQQKSSDGNAAAAVLDPLSAVKAAQAWYAQHDEQHPGLEMVAEKIFENSDRECSLLYSTDPNVTGNTYLERFKFNPPSEKNDWQWTVKSTPYEDDAAMYKDDVDPPEGDKLGELDQQTAVKAARRWYKQYFRLGGNSYKMDKVTGAFRNTELDIEPNEPHEWSLRYAANGDPTEYFLRFKYRAELDKDTGAWKWTAYGYSETEDASEYIGNSAEGYQDEQLSSIDDVPKKRSASSKTRATISDSHGGGGGRGPKSTKRNKSKKKNGGAVGNDGERAAASDRASDDVKAQIQDMKDKIREPKRELVQLPYVMPSAECEDEAYRDIGGPKVRVLCTVAEKLPLGFAPPPPHFSARDRCSCHGRSRSSMCSPHGLRMAVSLGRSTYSVLLLPLQQQRLAQ